MSKARGCEKCDANQRKAGEALSLFNEASAALLDLEQLLRDARIYLARDPYNASKSELAVADRVDAAIASAGERAKVLALL